MSMAGIKPTWEQSEPRVQAVQELRRSAAAGSHQDRRTRRDRAREQQKRNAIKNQED